MKFNLIYTDARDGYKIEHIDSYDKDIDPSKVNEWCKNVINVTWNEGIREHETKRKFIRVEIIDASKTKSDHKWNKFTGGQSVQFRGSIVDEMYCEVCRITGKRYGLSGTIRIDSKYKAKKYKRCDTALIAMTSGE